MSDQKTRPSTSASVLAITFGLTAMANAHTPASDLERRVEALEEQAAQNPITEDGGIRIAPNTVLKIYGYAKADLLFDSDFDLGNTIFGLAGLGAGSTPGSAFNAHAFQSRLGFTTETQTSRGVLSTRVEGDFFGSGGGGFRLRHAYGEFAGFLAGQTWTNWMPIESYPGTLDFQGPAGIPFARQAQFRYTFAPTDMLAASFSVENDPSAISDRAALTAAASLTLGSAFVKLGAVSREFMTGAGSEDGWGVNLSGNASLWEGGALQAAYTTGSGIGSYMVFGGADVDGAGNAIDTDGYTIGLTQDITDRFTIGLAYGKRDIDTGAATDTSELETIHLNVIYNLTDNATVGLEYITGERTQFDGASFSADRIQASAQFNF